MNKVIIIALSITIIFLQAMTDDCTLSRASRDEMLTDISRRYNTIFAGSSRLSAAIKQHRYFSHSLALKDKVSPQAIKALHALGCLDDLTKGEGNILELPQAKECYNFTRPILDGRSPLIILERYVEQIHYVEPLREHNNLYNALSWVKTYIKENPSCQDCVEDEQAMKLVKLALDEFTQMESKK